MVVVPSWLAAVQLRRRLADEGAGLAGHAGVRFFTPAALVERLGGYAAAEAGLRPLPRWGLELLAFRAACATDYFGRLAERPGFAAAVARTVRQLRLWGVPPERLHQEVAAASGPRERQRWQDLARLYEAVCCCLAPLGPHMGGAVPDPHVAGAAPGSRGVGTASSPFVDLAALVVLAGRVVASGKAPALLGAEEVWLWGVEEALEGARLWTGFWGLLQGPGSGLRVRRLPLFSAAGAVAGRPGSRLPPEALPPEALPPEAAARWAASTEAPDPGGVPDALAEPGDVAVRLVACTTELEEAEWIARELLHAAETGVPFWRMAVLMRHPHPYRHRVAGELARAQVRSFLPGPSGLPPGPVARAVAGWVALLRDGPTRPALMEWLRTAPLRAGWAGLAPQQLQPARWETLSIQAALMGDPAGWAEQLQRWLAARGASGPDGETARGLVEVLRTVAGELARMPPQGRWGELARALVGWMERTLEQSGDFQAVRSRLLELGGLDEVDEAAGTGSPVGWALFAEAVRDALVRSDGAGGPSRGRFEQGCVAVLTVEEALGCSFDVVAIPGLVRGRFPQGPPGDAVLASHELERLAGLPPASLAAAHARRERRLFAWAVSCARRLCVLCFPQAEGASAREHPPSPFLEELYEEGILARPYAAASRQENLAGHAAAAGQAFPPSAPLATSGRANPVAPSAPAAPVAQEWAAVAATALDIHELHRRLAGSLRTGAGGWLARRYPHAAEGARAHAARRWGPPGIFDGCLGPDSLDRLGPDTLDGPTPPAGGGPTYSPTELEAYARCPRLYLFSRLLGVEVADEPEASEGLAGLLRGQVVHLALRRFYDYLPEQLSGPAWQQALARAVEEAVAEACSGLTEVAAFARIQVEVLLALLTRWVQLERRQPPAGRLVQRRLEQPFADLAVSLSEELQIQLRGRIDRLEVFEQEGRQYVRVMDYKTGRPSARAADSLQAGLQLQPAVYLLAAAALTGVPPRACRAALVYLDTPTLPRWVELDGVGWESLKPRLARVLATLVGGVRQGYFAPDPHPDFGCERCRFYALCGPQARRFRERGGPAAFAQLQELREAGL